VFQANNTAAKVVDGFLQTRCNKANRALPCPPKLPASAAGRPTWPWTDEAPHRSDPADLDAAWPRISIVIPSLNHAQHLEACLRSVLMQGYPKLELIVIDGGSRDGTVEVLRKYEPWLTSWASEPDRGQTHAINKGFARSTGEVLNWLCCDDLLLPGSLHAIGRAFQASPETDLVYGGTEHKYPDDPSRDGIQRPAPRDIAMLPALNFIRQPSCFFRRRLLKRDPPLDESLDLVMDYDLWAYFFSQGARWKIIDTIVSRILWTGDNKCLNGGDRQLGEIERVYCRYVDERIPLVWWHRRLRNPLEKLWMRLKGRRIGFLRYALLAPELLYVLLLGPFYGFRRTALYERRGLYQSLMARRPSHGPRAEPEIGNQKSDI
jgi:glycosyltransferase involved in cell wall biosynthesis